MRAREFDGATVARDGLSVVTGGLGAGAVARRLLGLALAAVLGAAMSGCVSIKPSTPADQAAWQRGVVLVRGLPDVLPEKAVPLPDSSFVLVPAESAAGLLSPVPFVAEAILGSFDRSAAAADGARLRAVHPFAAVQAAMQGSTLLAPPGTTAPGLTMRPFVFLQECFDDRYRLALVAHVSGGDWVGRYVIHLPTAYPKAQFEAGGPALTAALSADLAAAAVQLRQLVERAARGELKSTGVRAAVGSFNLVGVRPAGLMSPSLIVARNGEVIEDTPERLLIRLPGDMSMAASAGGLFFGVHLLRKDQIHRFEPVAAR